MRTRMLTRLAAVAVAATLGLTACTSGGDDGGAAADGTQLLTIPREDMGTFTRNFNPFSPNVAPMTQQAIYESMLVYNPADQSTTPWLASSWTVADDGAGIDFTLRDGVQWSDGEPLVPQDVVTTFALQKQLMGGFEYLTDVAAVDEHTVRFTFDRPYSPALFEIGLQVLLPDHIWSTVADPAKDTNAEPVGTGPFTEVANFQSQSFDLMPNPHYWGESHIAGVRMLAFAGNDGANLAAASGDVDWAPQYFPNIEDAFVAKDPEHNHYWFPATGSMISWQLNTTQAPFDDVAVRKALSLAVDRDQVTAIGMSGYTHPADCTGMSDAYDSWRSDTVADACDWTTRDVDAADALLDEAGYPKGADGMRTLKDGSPFSFAFSVGSTSSDWLSVANIIAQNMKDIGVEVKVDAPDWATVVSSYEDGTFESGIVWANNAPTPFQFFRGMMSTGTVKPVGEKSFENYHRFGLPEADTLLDAFTATSDPAAQREAVDGLQQLFADNAPVIPLFPGPEFGAFTDVRFTGWPTADDPYATLNPRASTAVLVLTTLEPVVD